jgi:hypothetical protein
MKAPSSLDVRRQYPRLTNNSASYKKMQQNKKVEKKLINMKSKGLTVLLLISVVNAGRKDKLRSQLPSNFYDDYEHDEDKVDQEVGSLSIDNEAIADRMLGINESTPRFSCFSCAPPDCSHPTICHNALRCFTANIRETNGLESKSKGEKQTTLVFSYVLDWIRHF